MAPSNSPNKLRVLLVESNAIIGFHLADELEDQGYNIIGPFSCARAMSWLADHTPDVAVLDVDLQSGSCIKMARELRQRDVSIIVYTAHEQKHALPEFQDMPWIPIPAPREALSQALANH